MTDFDEQLTRNLAETFGPAAPYSDYQRGDNVRYRASGSVWSGVVLWVTAPAESARESRAGQTLPLRYVVARDGWENSIPDFVYSADILEGEK